MALIELKHNGPIVRNAMRLNTKALTEVGFIPNDEYGCKIYASHWLGKLTMIGIHSRSYGCGRTCQTDGIEVLPARVRK